MQKALLPLASILLLASWVDCLGQPQPENGPGQQFEIADCGVTYQANVAGATYTVTQDLFFGGPGDCIDVSAPGITVNLNGHSLSATPCNCEGISISKNAPGVHILGGGSITGRGLNYGIHDMGDVALIEDVTVIVQSTASIFLDGVRGSVVNGASVGSAAGYQSAGILLLDTDHCLVENSVADHNGNMDCGRKPCGGGVSTGILVGNSGSQNLSKNNFIVGNQADYNVTTGISVGGTGNVIVGNTANNNVSANQRPGGWGIFVGGVGIPGNLVIGNSASGNQENDLSDGNAQCGADHWVLNTFTTRNETCIH